MLFIRNVDGSVLFVGWIFVKIAPGPGGEYEFCVFKCIMLVLCEIL